MNTPTPRTDEWETYCDECYYHMWRVRRKNERGFDDGFHLQNGEGARQLVELLNKQDEALATVTEQRDRLAEELKETKKHLKDANRGAEINAHALRINADKLTTAREELADWRILNGWGGTPEIINDFIKGQQTRIHHAQNIEEELTTVTEQRDRLAEALRKAILWGESASHRILDRENINWTYLNEAREALQSLNEPTSL